MLAYSAPEGAAGLQVIAASDTEAFCRQFVLRLVSMQGLTALTIQAAVIKLAKNTTMRFIGLTVRFSNRWFNYLKPLAQSFERGACSRFKPLGFAEKQLFQKRNLLLSTEPP